MARAGFLHCATSGTSATREGSAQWPGWPASFRSFQPFLLPIYRPVAPSRPPRTYSVRFPSPAFAQWVKLLTPAPPSSVGMVRELIPGLCAPPLLSSLSLSFSVSLSPLPLPSLSSSFSLLLHEFLLILSGITFFK